MDNKNELAHSNCNASRQCLISMA